MCPVKIFFVCHLFIFKTAAMISQQPKVAAPHPEVPCVSQHIYYDQLAGCHAWRRPDGTPHYHNRPASLI